MKLRQRTIAAVGVATSLAGVITAVTPAQAADLPDNRGQTFAAAALPSTSPALTRYAGTGCNFTASVIACAVVGSYHFYFAKHASWSLSNWSGTGGVTTTTKGILHVYDNNGRQIACFPANTNGLVNWNPAWRITVNTVRC